MSTPRGEYRLLTGVGPAAICCFEAEGEAVAGFVAACIRTRRGDVATWQVGDVFRATLLDGESAIDDILITVHRAPHTRAIRVADTLGLSREPRAGGRVSDRSFFNSVLSQEKRDRSETGPPAHTDSEPRVSDDDCHVLIRLHLHGGPWIARRCGELLAAAGLSPASDDESDDSVPLDALIESEMNRALPEVLTLAGVHWVVRQAAAIRAEMTAIDSLTDRSTAAERLLALAQGAERLAWFTTPYRVALVGPPNAGKSTLLNALAGTPTSLVSDIPGTTRDWVEAPGEVGGFPITWIDTAGLRDAADAIEAEGIERTQRLAVESDTVVVLLDPAMPAPERRECVSRLASIEPAVVAWTKSDLHSTVPPPDELPLPWRPRVLRVSASRPEELRALSDAIEARTGRQERLARPGAFTERLSRILELKAESNRNSIPSMD